MTPLLAPTQDLFNNDSYFIKVSNYLKVILNIIIIIGAYLIALTGPFMLAIKAVGPRMKVFVHLPQLPNIN